MPHDSELEPGAADPAALSRIQQEAGNTAPSGAPDPEPTEPARGPGGEHPEHFQAEREREQHVAGLREKLADKSLPLRERNKVREELLHSLNMGQPIDDETPEREHVSALWETQGVDDEGNVLQAVAPDDLGEPAAAGNFAALAPQNEAELHERLDATFRSAPHFTHWLQHEADPETARSAYLATQSLVAAGVPSTLLGDLLRMEHETSKAGGVAHLSANGCWQSLQAGYGEEGAAARVREAHAVINSLPEEVATMWKQVLAESGLGNYPKYIERLSQFYRKGY